MRRRLHDPPTTTTAAFTTTTTTAAAATATTTARPSQRHRRHQARACLAPRDGAAAERRQGRLPTAGTGARAVGAATIAAAARAGRGGAPRMRPAHARAPLSDSRRQLSTTPSNNPSVARSTPPAC
eukprot:scaffold921_cov397-Prasinococcus_capsulatus_cf.AAC.12